MRRRDAASVILFGSMVARAQAQRAGTTRRLLVLMSGGQAVSKQSVEGLLEGLQAKGWVDGRNFQVDIRYVDGDPARARAAAAAAVDLAPDLVLAGGTVVVNALRDAKVRLPVVFVNITDPVAGGFVPSLAHPGANMSGFTPFRYDIGGKWLQLLREAVPELTHAAMLGDQANHNYAGFVHSFLAAAKAMNIEPTLVPIQTPADIERAIEAEARRPHGGMVVTAATFSLTHRGLLISAAAKSRLPAIYWNSEFVQSGGLMAYGPQNRALYRASADYVDRIFKGAPPGDLPVQAPDQIDLSINLKAAEALGVAVPRTLLMQAQDVIH